MYRFVDLFLAVIIFLFFFIVYNYYSSNKNIKNVNLNRLNIQENLKSQSTNLPILDNDTNDVIEFNSSFSNEIEKEKKRNFWNLLKIK